MILKKMRSFLRKMELWFWIYSWIRLLCPSGSNVVSRSQAPRSINFLAFQNLLDSSYDSWKKRPCLWILEPGFWTYGWIRLLGPSYPNVVPRPQAPKSINFNGFFSWFLRKWGLVCENWSQGSALVAGCLVGPSGPNVVFRPRPQDPSIFWDFMILLDSSHNSWENEVLFLKIEARVLI